MDRPSRIIKLPARFAEGTQPQSNASDVLAASSTTSTTSTRRAPSKQSQGEHRLMPYKMQHRFKPYVPSPLSAQLKGEELHNHKKRRRWLERPSKVKLCGEKDKTCKCKQKVFDDFDKLTNEQKDVKRDKNGRWQASLDPVSWADAVNEAEGFQNAREARGIMEEPPRVFLKCLGLYPEEHRPSQYHASNYLP